MAKLTVVPSDKSTVETEKEINNELQAEKDKFLETAKKNAERIRKLAADRRSTNESIVRNWNLRTGPNKRKPIKPRN